MGHSRREFMKGLAASAAVNVPMSSQADATEPDVTPVRKRGEE